MGGFYWIVNLVVAQSSCFFFAYVYLVSDNPYPHVEKLSPETVWAAIVPLQLVFCLSFGCFVAQVNPKYLFTFFGTVRGVDYLHFCFDRPECTDLVKFEMAAVHHRESPLIPIVCFCSFLMLITHRAPRPTCTILFFLFAASYVKSVRGALRIWLADNWERFVEEKPEWFETLAPKLPQDLVPRGAHADIRALGSSLIVRSNNSVSVKDLKVVRLSQKDRSLSLGAVRLRHGPAAPARGDEEGGRGEEEWGVTQGSY